MATEAVKQLRQIIADQLRWSTLDSSELADELVDMIVSTRADLTVKVLLEIGALAPDGVLDTESGLLHVCGPDDEPEPQDVRVYRLATEDMSG